MIISIFVPIKFLNVENFDKSRLQHMILPIDAYGFTDKFLIGYIRSKNLFIL